MLVNIEPSSSEPVTALVRRRIKPGCEQRFEELMQEFVRFVLQQPGHLSITIVRPTEGSRDYTVVDHFTGEQARRAFTSSPEYAEWRNRLVEVTEGEPTISEMGGLAPWFTLPDRPVRLPPPMYKMAVVTLMGVYPLSLLFSGMMERLAGAWPFWLTGLVIAALIVISLTWVVMPILTRLMEKWLFRTTE
jgi:antibiotic biosynthesis monooxygenase (ABM) superfamily enzyme